jgi:hypothetical protein
MPKVGLEPTPTCVDRILSPARLPFRHFGNKLLTSSLAIRCARENPLDVRSSSPLSWLAFRSALHYKPPTWVKNALVVAAIRHLTGKRLEANLKGAGQFRPQLELLEGRLPLSAVSSSPVHDYPNTHHLALGGQLSGIWSTVPSILDVGMTQNLSGAGHVENLGDVQLSGRLTTPGNIASGRTTGEFALTDHHGSVTFRLVGAHLQPGMSGPVNKYYFAIEGGTGMYTHIWGGGIATLQEQPASQIGPHSDAINPPSFTLTLQGYK